MATLNYVTAGSIYFARGSSSTASTTLSSTLPQYSVLYNVLAPLPKNPSYRGTLTGYIRTGDTGRTLCTTSFNAGNTSSSKTVYVSGAAAPYPYNASERQSVYFACTSNATGTEDGSYVSPIIRYYEHEITWSSVPIVTVEGNSAIITTKADDNFLSAGGSGDVTYTFYIDDVLTGTSTGASKQDTTTTFSQLTEGQHSLDVIPSFGGLSGETQEILFTVGGHGTVKYYQNSQWIECIPYVYTNNEFVEVEPYIYDGSLWIPCSH